MENVWLLAIVIIAYLCGAFPTARLATRKKLKSVNEWHGDSWGTMSTLQKAGWKKALVVLLGDVSKGFLPVFLAIVLAPFLGYSLLWAIALASLATVLGHCWSCFNQWQGGRGLATGFGALLAVNWALALAGLGILVLFILLTELWLFQRLAGGFKKIIRDNLLGRVIGLVVAPAVFYFVAGPGIFWALLPMMILIIYVHRQRVRIFIKEHKEILWQRLGAKN
jgi:glycerol-3-phosphate acyltransferase PlsY